MKSHHIKNSITYFFLALFLIVKVTGLHVFSHSDDKEDAKQCIICDHAITHNLTPTVITGSQDFSIKNVEFVVVNEIITSYSFLRQAITTKGLLFSRPPPILV